MSNESPTMQQAASLQPVVMPPYFDFFRASLASAPSWVRAMGVLPCSHCQIARGDTSRSVAASACVILSRSRSYRRRCAKGQSAENFGMVSFPPVPGDCPATVGIGETIHSDDYRRGAKATLAVSAYIGYAAAEFVAHLILDVALIPNARAKPKRPVPTLHRMISGAALRVSRRRDLAPAPAIKCVTAYFDGVVRFHFAFWLGLLGRAHYGDTFAYCAIGRNNYFRILCDCC